MPSKPTKGTCRRQGDSKTTSTVNKIEIVSPVASYLFSKFLFFHKMMMMIIGLNTTKTKSHYTTQNQRTGYNDSRSVVWNVTPLEILPIFFHQNHLLVEMFQSK